MRSRDCGVRSGLWKASGKHGSPVGVSQSSREGTCYGLDVGNWRRVLESDCQPVAGCRLVSVTT